MPVFKCAAAFQTVSACATYVEGAAVADEEKRVRILRYARDHHVDLNASHAYGDSVAGTTTIYPIYPRAPADKKKRRLSNRLRLFSSLSKPNDRPYGSRCVYLS